MLPINFESLAAQEPELRQVLGLLSGWIRAHPDWDILDPRVLALDLRLADTWLLSLALASLVSEGLYRPFYMVETPTGVLAEQRFANLQDIPPYIRDRWEHEFATSGSEIIQVLAPAKVAVDALPRR